LHAASERVQSRLATIRSKVESALGELPIAFVNGRCNASGAGEAFRQAGVAAGVEVAREHLPDARP
jgi:hypothetical protein